MVHEGKTRKRLHTAYMCNRWIILPRIIATGKLINRLLYSLLSLLPLIMKTDVEALFEKLLFQYNDVYSVRIHLKKAIRNNEQ